MGIDGSEIKRQRELREKQAKKEAERLAAREAAQAKEVAQSTPESPELSLSSPTKKPPTISNFIFGAAGFLVVILIIVELFEPSPSPQYSNHSSLTPRPAQVVETNYPSQAISADGAADAIVAIINSMYGNVCSAELSGFFTKTLKIDWTPRTNKLHAIKVLAEVGTVKEKLYIDGVRYFQFPNDAGTYNVIDWKTGGKKSNSDRAPYYFSD